MKFHFWSAGETWTFAGYFVGAFVLWWGAKKRGLDTDGMRWVGLAGLVGGVVGARLTQGLLSAPSPGLSHWLDPRAGGKSLVGGLICGYLCVVWAKKRLGILRSTGDLWALAIPAGEAVGRVGCFLNGCCEGTIWNGTWAIWQNGAWRHPAPFYSALGALFLCGFLLWIAPKLSREGDLFRVFVVLYGLMRFGVEFFRERDFVWRDWSLVQILCLEIALGTLLVWAWQFKKARHFQLHKPASNP